MAKPKKPVKKPTQRALAVAATHQAGVAKLLELMAEEMGEGGRAARLASKARMAGDPELRALVDRRGLREVAAGDGRAAAAAPLKRRSEPPPNTGAPRRFHQSTPANRA
jgi:hypothetical protein